MKRFLAITARCTIVWVVIFVVLEVMAGDRSHVDAEASLRITQTHLISLSDGGCSVQAFASVTSNDGGVTQEPSAVVQVAGANRTSCLDVLTKSLVLFKSTNGF